MGYKQVRYNNMFDYSIEHNKHAFVYFNFKNGSITDSYLSLNPTSGPLVHGIMVLIGTLLLIK
jgi:type IV secretory pathway component VirB8